MENIKETMLEKKNWAIVGVSENKDRYAYKIWKLMPEHGYNVFGVNPKYNELEGVKIYNSLKDIDEKIDVVDVVVNPRLSLKLLDEIKELGIEYVFFQPETYNDEVVEKANNLGLKILTGDCIYATLIRKEMGM